MLGGFSFAADQVLKIAQEYLFEPARRIAWSSAMRILIISVQTDILSPILHRASFTSNNSEGKSSDVTLAATTQMGAHHCVRNHSRGEAACRSDSHQMEQKQGQRESRSDHAE